jgi:hypothetical protein
MENFSIETNFEKEKYKRMIEECRDINELKKVTKQLIDAFYTNKEFIRELLFKAL